MNSMIKTAIASTLALAATSAFAALPDPSTNNSNLVLVVQNATTQATYVLDTGITINSLVGPLSASAKADTTTWDGISKSISAANLTGLQAFLTANPVAGDQWGIQGAQYAGSANNSVGHTPGNVIDIFTSAGGTANVSQITGLTLGNLNTYAGGTFSSLTAGGGLSPLATAAQSSNGTPYSTADQQKYGLFLVNDMSAVGTPSELFAITGNGALGTESYNAGTVTLQADGTLVFAGNGTVTPPPVPLPAAVWLFGSGLMGLVGVSRRRKAAAAAV